MNLRVEYTRRARDQLQSIFEYIADAASPRVAEHFVSALLDYCDSFAQFPERGLRRDDIRPRLRLIGFRRRLTIAFRVDADAVRILGVFYGGQDVEAALSEKPPDDD
jgi:toxin ParE1/3/4